MMEIAQAAAMQKNFNVWVDGFLAKCRQHPVLQDMSCSLRQRIAQGCRMVCAAIREDPYAAQPCRQRIVTLGRFPHVVSKHAVLL